MGADSDKGRRQAHRMARGAVAASVALVSVTFVIVVMRVGMVSVVACGHHMFYVVVIERQRTHRGRMGRSAKLHECRSLCLKRHCEHHEP